jgi:hypothetical protein
MYLVDVSYSCSLGNLDLPDTDLTLDLLLVNKHRHTNYLQVKSHILGEVKPGSDRMKYELGHVALAAQIKIDEFMKSEINSSFDLHGDLIKVANAEQVHSWRNQESADNSPHISGCDVVLNMAAYNGETFSKICVRRPVDNWLSFNFSEFEVDVTKSTVAQEMINQLRKFTVGYKNVIESIEHKPLRVIEINE